MTDIQPVLSLKDLDYSYRHQWTGRLHKTLHSLTLDVQEGEAFGFLGHNGAGKTTTIKAILGLIKVKDDAIKIMGQPSRLSEARKDVGYLPEQPYFYDHLTVKETLSFYAVLAGVPKKHLRDAIERALEMVKLTERIKSPLRTLSKGLTQRVAMAQAIIAKPKLLILDEPFSGLDPLGRRDFRELLFQLKKEGTTLFMSSHILSDVEYLCDRCSIMVKGRIKGVFALSELRESTKGQFELVLRDSTRVRNKLLALSPVAVTENHFLQLTYSKREDAEAALQIALEEKAPIESFKFRQPSLEEIFVNLVEADQRTDSGN